MSTWADFEPFVLPDVPGCPDATIEHHLRQAAIEFCRFTKVWQADLAPIAGDGAATVFAMPKPDDGEPCKLLSVTVNVTGFAPMQPDVLTPEDGAVRIRDSDLRPCAFTGDLSGLVVWPAQPAGASIVAKVALMPSQAAATLPTAVFNQHAADIAAGALSTLLAQSKKDWTDTATAAIQAGTFSGRKATVARIVEHGFAKSTRRPTTRWF